MTEAVMDFTALAPRRGTTPLMASSYSFGNSSLNGGALSWSGLWSGIKNFGSTVKNWGQSAWNSSTGQALRQNLKDTGLQQKVVEGISTAIHGAVDLGRQELDRQLASRLDADRRPVPTAAPPLSQTTPTPPTTTPGSDTLKRPLVEVEPPPSYEEVVGFVSEPPTHLTKDIRPGDLATVAAVPAKRPALDVPTTLDLPPPSIRRPSVRASASWQAKLRNVVGAGVRARRYRRCY